MAGKIIADTIQTESTFLQLNVSNTQVATINASGIYSNTGGKIIGSDGTFGNSTIVNATVSANLNFDTTGTSGIRLPAANTLAFHTTGAEDMRIDSSGNVGIGTTSPSQKLDINGNVLIAANSNLYFNNASGYSPRLSNSVSNDALSIFTNNTERMRIDSSGRMTMSAQPFSHAYGTSQTVNSGVILQFSAALVNQGNHYNTSTYTFTAPIAGDYLVMIGIRRDSGQTSGYSRFTVLKNGTDQAVNLKIHDPIAVLNTASLSNASQNSILRLAANDYLQVIDYGSSSYPTVYNLAESHFMVRLLG